MCVCGVVWCGACVCVCVRVCVCVCVCVHVCVQVYGGGQPSVGPRVLPIVLIG